MEDTKLKTLYALIWKADAADGDFDQQQFENRIPRLMQWLKKLKADGKLLACGGGGFENHSGGLTLIYADSVEEAIALSKASPMNEIGKTELLVWDLFYADLVDKRMEEKLS